MHTSTIFLGIALSLTVVTFANPVQRSATLSLRHDPPQPSDYPYGTAYLNEFKWLNWDPDNEQDKSDAEKIHQAFGEWADLIREGANAAADKNSDTFKRWFGIQENPGDIKKVFGNMWSGDNTNPIVARMVCNRQDFENRCRPGTRAYTLSDSGEFHVCPRGLNMKQNSEINCDSLAASCSSAMRSLSMTLLHEMTHFDAIGADARGSMGIIDIEAGSYDCFTLDDDSKSDNAQNYAWLAGEAYFTKRCNKIFSDPMAGVESSYETDDPLPPSITIPAPVCAGTPSGTPQLPFPQPDADAAIIKFCSNRIAWGQVIVPAVSFGTGLTNDGRHKALGISDSFPINGGADKLWIGLSFSEGDCMGSFQFDVGANDDEKLANCVVRFRTILNGCNVEGLFPKYGGELGDACAIYRMTARKADQASPLTLKSEGDLGAFTCRVTDTSATGGASSPLAGTCTCWYANIPGPTDVFKMPASGNCADTNPAELVIN